MKLLAKYDSVLEKHLQNVSENPGSVHYMSKTVQNELIHLMAEEVKDVIKGEIQCSKYFGMLFDTTPDLAKREEMSQVIRYVHIDYEMKTVCVKETFLGFIEIYEKDAGAVSSAILKKTRI